MKNHLWTLAMISSGLWVVGLAFSYTMGGFIHVLIAITAVLLMARIMQRHLVL